MNSKPSLLSRPEPLESRSIQVNWHQTSHDGFNSCNIQWIVYEAQCNLKVFMINDWNPRPRRVWNLEMSISGSMQNTLCRKNCLLDAARDRLLQPRVRHDKVLRLSPDQYFNHFVNHHQQMTKHISTHAREKTKHSSVCGGKANRTGGEPFPRPLLINTYHTHGPFAW